MAVRQNVIKIGSREAPALELDNAEIISVNGQLACDLLCEEIPIDTLEIQCRYDRMRRGFAPSDFDGLQTADGLTLAARSASSGSVPDIPYAAGLWYYNDGNYIGKFYVSDAKRTGKYVYTITAQSAIGVLDGMTYYGGLMLNVPLADALRDILLTDGLQDTKTAFLTDLYASLTLADGLDAVRVTGWIPVGTKREALHHVLFAAGLNIFKAETDAFLIARVSGTSAGSIDARNIYDSGSVDLTDRVKRVEVAEHSFVENPNAEETVLYDNTESSVDTEAVICFDSAPVVVGTVKATGTIRIKKINVNAAVVSGVGTLAGKPYAHITQTITRDNANVLDGQTVTVTEATCVNSINSNAVADRVFAFHTQRKPMQLGVVLNGEQCGRKYACKSPYGDPAAAYITAMRIAASAIAKADCTVIDGYTPAQYASEFNNVVLLTGSGTFTVPEVVFASASPRIRVVLIGGGMGGDGGNPGKDGKSKIADSNDDMAAPGSPGNNGAPGRRVVVQIEGSRLQRSYTYTCGAGGEGGAGGSSGSNGAAGGNGGATSFRASTVTYSTFNAQIPEAGYLDIITGRVYGGYAPDYSGVISGSGGGYSIEGESELLFGSHYVPSTDGQYIVNGDIGKATGYAVGAVKKGSHGHRANVNTITIDDVQFQIMGGSGGGGPITALTDNADKCKGTRSFLDGTDLYLGDGGDGANAPEAPAIMDINHLGYGMGGIGGMGGGGGGMAGVYSGELPAGIKVYNGAAGSGGRGGNGGAGGPGCILVYY